MTSKKILLVVVAVCGLLAVAVLMFWKGYIEPYQRQARILEELEKANLTDAWSCTGFSDEPPFPAWLNDWLPESMANSRRKLTRLELMYGVENELLPVIAPESPKEPPVVDLAKARLIRRLPDLWFLELTEIPIEDDLVETLIRMKKLECLCLDGVEITEARLRRFAEIPNLTWLTLLRVPGLSDEAMADLISAAPQLRHPRFVDMSGLGNRTLKALVRHPGLRSIGLVRSGIHDEHLKILAERTRHESLDLSGNPGVTDEGLKFLEATRITRKICLEGTGVTQAGVDSFQKSHPGCKIVWR